jgi:hypothetical protein
MTDGMLLGLATLGVSVIAVTVVAAWKLSLKIGCIPGQIADAMDKHRRDCASYEDVSKVQPRIQAPAAVPAEASER